MEAAHSTPSEQAWLYKFIASTALPAVDFSQSLKSRYLPPVVLHIFDSFLRRWKCSLTIMYAFSLFLSPVVLYVEAPVGRIVAVFALLLGLPLGLGGLGALRFEMVRLLVREDSVVFFVLLNFAAQVLTGILLGDLRVLCLVNVYLGFVNAVLIDARLRAVRWFTLLCIMAVLMVAVCLVALMQGRVDQVNDAILWQYQEGVTVYDVCLSEYVTTGIFTLLILLAKIVYRKLRSMRDSPRASVIQCAMFQCRIRLVACSRDAQPPDRAGPCADDRTPQGDVANSIQQLKLAHVGRVYDARKILLPMTTVSCPKPFSWVFLIMLYAIGLVGFVLLFTSSSYGTSKTNESEAYEAAIASTTFSSSLVFCLIFAACYQRELLQSLVISFDFIFYSFQITTPLLAGAFLSRWDRNQCLWLLTNWVWAHWVFSLDALTPVMKAKLRFHVWYAIPVVLTQLLGGIKLLHEVVAHMQYVPEDSVLWSGQVLDRGVKLHMLPFQVSRLLIATTWTLRLLLRLCRASNADAIIMKGAVIYNNYLSQPTRSRELIKFRMNNRNLKRMLNPTISKLLNPYGAQVSPEVRVE